MTIQLCFTSISEKTRPLGQVAVFLGFFLILITTLSVKITSIHSSSIRSSSIHNVNLHCNGVSRIARSWLHRHFLLLTVSRSTLAVLYNFLLAGNQGDVTIKIHFNEMKKIFPHFFERFWIFDPPLSVVAPSVGQAEEVALPDVGVSLSYNARKFFSRPKERVKSRHFFSKSRENNTTAINWEQNIFFGFN